jgi:hypothetical protein
MRRANWREVRHRDFPADRRQEHHASDALANYGADLFIKENDKKDLGKEKIDEKIFEIERRLLIRKRS